MAEFSIFAAPGSDHRDENCRHMNCTVVISDERNATYASVTVASVVWNGTRHPIRMILYQPSDRTRAMVKTLADDLGHDIAAIDASAVDLSGFPRIGRYEGAVWLKLFIAELLPDTFRRAVYLDTDTVAVSSIDPLFELPLQPHSAAATPDIATTANARKPALGIPDHGTYFNTGVMAIDLREWRARRIGQRAREHVRALGPEAQRLTFADQDALHAAAWWEFGVLDRAWNVLINYLDPSDEDLLKNARVVHFAGQKPWDRHELPGAELYDFYRGTLGWGGAGMAFRRILRAAGIERMRRAAVEAAKLAVYPWIGRADGLVRARRRMSELRYEAQMRRCVKEFFDANAKSVSELDNSSRRKLSRAS